MASFKDVVGHEQIIEHLKGALVHDKVSHAYIFNGDHGTGKNMLARLFAMALQCEAGGGDACGICRSCLMAWSGNHPDIRWVRHEKPASIGVDDVREQINNDIIIKPYSGKYKIYIVDEAEKMTPQAQNALLKTIEEPPVYAVIMLLTNNVKQLLPTISSRCVVLNMRAADLEQIQQFLMHKYQIPDYKAKICAAFSQGSVGKAVKMAANADFAELQERIIHLLKHVDGMDIYEIVDTVKMLTIYKADIYDIIDMMMIWYRDVLMLKLTKNPNLVIFQEDLGALMNRTTKSSFEGLDTIIQGMEKAKVRLAANVNYDTVLELMLLTIKEN